MNWKKDLIRVIDLAGLDDKPEKYVKEFEAVLKLFDEIDKYLDIIDKYEPLYHPLEILTEPREDSVYRLDMDKKIPVDDDGYIRGPPIKRK